MELTKEQVEKLKIIELEIFKQFISVCEKLNLKYYLLGGTLLGAVRHQGFIPWDDDIDVGMPREDYEIFIREAQQYLPVRYFVQTNVTDPDLPMNFAKVRDSETTYIETSVKDRKINHGAYIDVFPLDKHPDDEKELKKFQKKNVQLFRIIRKVFTLDKRVSFLRHVKQKLIQLLPSRYSWKKAVALREELLKSNKGEKMLANYCGAWGKKEIVPTEWYGEGAELTFEGLKVNAPKEYKAWLTQVYGDYMQLPPEEKRVGHHYTEIIDLEKSYTEYMK